MAGLADGFIALPGGIGTLEEFAEIVTWAHLGLHAKPTGLLNLLGYYDELLGFLDHATRERFVRPGDREQILAGPSAAELLAVMGGWTAPPPGGSGSTPTAPMWSPETLHPVMPPPDNKEIDRKYRAASHLGGGPGCASCSTPAGAAGPPGHRFPAGRAPGGLDTVRDRRDTFGAAGVAGHLRQRVHRASLLGCPDSLRPPGRAGHPAAQRRVRPRAPAVLAAGDPGSPRPAGRGGVGRGAVLHGRGLARDRGRLVGVRRVRRPGGERDHRRHRGVAAPDRGGAGVEPLVRRDVLPGHAGHRPGRHFRAAPLVAGARRHRVGGRPGSPDVRARLGRARAGGAGGRGGRHHPGPGRVLVGGFPA